MAIDRNETLRPAWIQRQHFISWMSDGSDENGSFTVNTRVANHKASMVMADSTVGRCLKAAAVRQNSRHRIADLLLMM